jgi:hypothetical protein
MSKIDYHLSISKKDGSLDCDEIARKLALLGSRTTVQKIVSSNRVGCVEHGCLFTHSISSEKEFVRLWKNIKHCAPGIRCAHLHMTKRYEGCVLKYMDKNSVCLKK